VSAKLGFVEDLSIFALYLVFVEEQNEEGME
jgi:hypothetical protein